MNIFNDPLETLREHFRKEPLDCEIIELEDSQRRLIVYLGMDSDERGLNMEITAQTLAIDGKLFSSPTPNQKALVRVQFDVVYPLKIEDKAIFDVAQFLHFLNLQIELPGFYLNQINNQIIYRHVWLCEREHFSPPVALNIAGMALFFHGTFEMILNRLAQGKDTYLSLLEELARII